MKKGAKKKFGFTFLELVIVIAIMGILTTISASSYSSIVKKSRDSKRKADIEEIRSSLELYRSNNGYYPLTVDELLGPTVYMQRRPHDPLASQGYSYQYTPLPSSPTQCNNNLVPCVDYRMGAKLETDNTCTSAPSSTCSGSTACNYCLGPFGEFNGDTITAGAPTIAPPTNSPPTTEPTIPVPGTSVRFVKADTTTHGNWKGVYGTKGYNIIADSQNYPSFVQITPSNNSTHTWVAITNDSRGLQMSNGNYYIAATWYAFGTESIDINFTDGLTHQLSIYNLDWDNASRTQDVVLYNATTNAVLDTQSVASFYSGIYLVWNISGHVLMTISRTGNSPNAVVSGLFFD